MLVPPDGLDLELLPPAIAAGWGIEARSLDYLPLGWGSHHWATSDASGRRWFVTVDELDGRRWSEHESLDEVFGRLSASLSVAVELAAHGLVFAVGPVPTLTREPVLRLGERFSIGLYPFVSGESFGWGEFSSPQHRLATLRLIIAVHTAPLAARRRAMADDLTIAFRDALEATLAAPDGKGGSRAGGRPAALGGPAAGGGPATGGEPSGGSATGGSSATGGGSATGGEPSGPYDEPTVELIKAHAPTLHRLLARYDSLVPAASTGPVAPVLTHGEPHPGNTMRTPAGWLLIDWDTALIAPPERDLWDLDPGDGSVHAAYQAATGVTLRQPVFELYRLRWELTDIAMAAGRFRAQHSGNTDDSETFELLGKQLNQLAG
jgi:spectinomycin phosphotransferase